ncbi:hypothetical protein [Streptomyces sp. NPDC091416]|uniref:hypothetical protein n=1 Tax=Streptomyces sp. NPDC091416 TaxID=3366003 RepID=UPI0037F6A8C6
MNVTMSGGYVKGCVWPVDNSAACRSGHAAVVHPGRDTAGSSGPGIARRSRTL